jgi:hypothetical protein
MFTSLRGGPLYAATVIVVAVVATATVLAWHGTLTGSDWLIVITPILTGVVGVTSAHVAGTALGNALNTYPPVPGGTGPGPPAGQNGTGPGPEPT